jgi:hypothetical protein
MISVKIDKRFAPVTIYIDTPESLQIMEDIVSMAIEYVVTGQGKYGHLDTYKGRPLKDIVSIAHSTKDQLSRWLV